MEGGGGVGEFGPFIDGPLRGEGESIEVGLVGTYMGYRGGLLL